MDEKVVESVDGNDKADGFEELGEDVERVVRGQGNTVGAAELREY